MTQFIVPTGFAEARRGQFVRFNFLYESRSTLEKLWLDESLSATTDAFEKARRVYTDDSDIRFSRAIPEPTKWSIAFTPTFLKSMSGVDKNMQGRILIALAQLSKEPIALQGDTIKPLDGSLKGLWRFRIGDYRLVYEPRENSKLVVLVDFASRGGVYK